MTQWNSTNASTKHRRAYTTATDLLDILDVGETDVTVEDIDGWRDDEIYDWLETWGLRWDGAGWVGRAAFKEC